MGAGRPLPIQFCADAAAGVSVCARPLESRKNRMEATHWSVLRAAVACLFPMWRPQLSSVLNQST